MGLQKRIRCVQGGVDRSRPGVPTEVGAPGAAQEARSARPRAGAQNHKRREASETRRRKTTVVPSLWPPLPPEHAPSARPAWSSPPSAGFGSPSSAGLRKQVRPAHHRVKGSLRLCACAGVAASRHAFPRPCDSSGHRWGRGSRGEETFRVTATFAGAPRPPAQEPRHRAAAPAVLACGCALVTDAAA